MSLPLISGRQAFERLGWTFVRQKGSHMILTKPGQSVSLSVPDHATLGRGTLRSLLRASGHSEQEFLEALD